MKDFILKIYKILNSLNIFIIFLVKQKRSLTPILFLNGAISGSSAGPKVKVKRIKSLFKISRFNPNIFYCLSNGIYSYNKIVKKFVKSKIPIIYNQNGVFHENWYKGNVNSRNKDMKFYLKNSDYVFFQSKFCKKCCDEHIYKRKKNFKILYNAVDTKIFVPTIKNDNAYIPILKIGTYTKANMWRLFNTIEAIKNVNKLSSIKYKLSIVGAIENDLKNKVKRLIKKYNMNNDIFFLGKINQKKLVKIMQQHTIFLTTKLHDPCSNAIIEAMACGLPVIFHNSGGNFELVGNAGWGVGERQTSISDISIESDDILKKLKKITKKEIELKSKIARFRAEKYFDITKWEREHLKVFKYYTARLDHLN